MQVEDWPLDRIKRYERNPRKRSKKSAEKIAASIREFGPRQPIVVDEAGVILVGHGRLDAAELLKLSAFPVHQALGLSEQQKTAYRIADNRTNEESEFDEDTLKLELSSLEGFDLTMTGFDLRQVNGYLRGGPVDGEDDVPEPGEPVTKPGDLWVMGEHRLLCGDATNAADVARLMEGERAGLMNTDPPYGIGYDSKELHPHGVSLAAIDNDQHRDRELQHFLERAFRAAVASALLPNAAWYLWHAMLTQGFFAAAAAAAAHVILHRQIIWVKPILVFGRGQYHWKHELCFMGWVEGHQCQDYGDHTETTVWNVDGVKRDERKEMAHSTPKPVELFRRPILKHLKPGEIAYEPFAGTGPQFIAAQAEGRRCYGLEIEPRYCDVIRTRWEKFTGKTAVLEHREVAA